MNQVQRVLDIKAPIHTVAGQKYKGQQPKYAKRINQKTGVEEFVKVSRGIPFVRVS